MASLPPPEVQVLSQQPKVQQDARTKAKLKTKLQLEASIEAYRAMTLPIIAPEDLKMHQSNALEQNTHCNERALLYYTEMEEALDKELREMDESIARCREIEAKLLEDDEPDTETGEEIRIARQFRSTKKAFVEFKNVLRNQMKHLTERYPRMNIADVVSSLTSKMVDHPNDPYMDMDELECEENTLSFLIKLNLVQRHPEEPRKIRLLDSRIK